MRILQIMLNRKLTNETLDLKASLYKRLANVFYLIAVALTSIGAYGYYLTNPSPSIDWLSYDEYYSGVLFGQGRFTATIVERLLNLWDCPVWFEPLLGLALFILGSLILLAIFDGFTEQKSIAPSIIFTCIYISFPLLSEYFVYNGALLTVGGSTVLLSLALYLLIKYRDFFRSIIIPTLLMSCVVSWYESLILPFIGAVFAVLLLDMNKNGKIKFGELILRGLPSAIVLAFSVVLEFVSTKLLIKIFSIPTNSNAITGTRWYYSFEAIRDLIYSYMANWFAMVFCNPAFAVLFTVFVVFIIIMIADVVKHRSFSRFAVHFGLLIPVFAMTFFRCGGKEYRTEQGIPFFVAFVCYYIVMNTLNVKIVLKRLLAVAFSFIIIFQIGGINRAFWINNLRFEEEKNVILTVNSILVENNDLSKPVVFIGSYTLSNNIKEKVSISESSVSGKIIKHFYNEDMNEKRLRKYDFLGSSYIEWALKWPLVKDKPNSELYKFCDYIGIEYKHCTKAQFEDATKRYSDIPSYPDKGCIVENKDYIVVKF